MVTKKLRSFMNNQVPHSMEGNLEKPYEAVLTKFYQFNGTNNAREHLAYFEATCDNTANNSSLLHQFSRSLTSVSFYWSSRLLVESISNWTGMKNVFRKHFVTMKIYISIIKLSQVKQEEFERQGPPLGTLSQQSLVAHIVEEVLRGSIQVVSSKQVL
jgi:hypothetical protein